MVVALFVTRPSQIPLRQVRSTDRKSNVSLGETLGMRGKKEISGVDYRALPSISGKKQRYILLRCSVVLVDRSDAYVQGIA